MANLRETERVEEVFEFVRKSEETVLDAGRNWVKAFGEFMPLETPVLREIVKGGFDFAEEVLKAQTEFAHNMLKATRPMRMRKSEASPRATPAHRAASKVA